MKISTLIKASSQVCASVIKPLYGHTSESTAYLVEDYPYSFKLRTQIRYWLEYKPNKGWRFVAQTLNPKTQRWNKPKASTYAEWGGAMYLNEQDHVKWDGLQRYSDPENFMAFLKNFPKADMTMIKKVVPGKIKLYQDLIDGKRVLTVNNKPQERSEREIESDKKELAAWEEIAKHVH